MRTSALIVLVLAALLVACGCLWKSDVIKVTRSKRDPETVKPRENEIVANKMSVHPQALATTNHAALAFARPLPSVSFDPDNLGNFVR